MGDPRTKLDILYQESLGDIDKIITRIEKINTDSENITTVIKKFNAIEGRADKKIDDINSATKLFNKNIYIALACTFLFTSLSGSVSGYIFFKEELQTKVFEIKPRVGQRRNGLFDAGNNVENRCCQARGKPSRHEDPGRTHDVRRGIDAALRSRDAQYKIINTAQRPILRQRQEFTIRNGQINERRHRPRGLEFVALSRSGNCARALHSAHRDAIADAA